VQATTQARHVTNEELCDTLAALGRQATGFKAVARALGMRPGLVCSRMHSEAFQRVLATNPAARRAWRRLKQHRRTNLGYGLPDSYAPAPLPAEACPFPPGSPEKIAVLRGRACRREALHHPRDGVGAASEPGCFPPDHLAVLRRVLAGQPWDATLPDKVEADEGP
jgi:hypothetical protein